MNEYSYSDRWWAEAAGFFGSFYLQGDDSLEGFLSEERLSLEARTSREVEGVCKLVGLWPDDRILDVPCGAGRHAVALALRGFDVVGVDLNETHLRAARQHARYAHARALFKLGDMRSLSFEHEFDVVINMFYSFGFFANDKDNHRALERFRRALRPGGRFLMHTDVNLERIRNGAYRLSEERHLRNGGVLHIEERFDKLSQRIHGSWTIEHQGGVTRREYSVRVYEVEEFISLCLSCGFSRCVAYGDWGGGPYSVESEEIIFVAD